MPPARPARAVAVRAAGRPGEQEGAPERPCGPEGGPASEELRRQALRLPPSQGGSPAGGAEGPGAGTVEDADLFDTSETGPWDAKGPRLAAALVLVALAWLYIGRYLYECVYVSGGVNIPGGFCAW
mmetsp:Transcript_109518/g.353456  ORF Transcript_109518/g.353456 Transcript_109518/m.353456 type:complete len:126 (-) Transcript_109518:18-395(-)